MVLRIFSPSARHNCTHKKSGIIHPVLRFRITVEKTTVTRPFQAHLLKGALSSRGMARSGTDTFFPKGRSRSRIMDGNARSWEADYRARGRLWGGSAGQLPDLPGGSRILDLGCGDGKTLSSLAACGWDPVALDFSGHATRLCRKNAGIFANRVLTADARALPFRDGSFDAVLAFHVVGHMTAEDRTIIAREVVRVLPPGGVLVFREFSTDDFRYGRGEQVEEGTFRRGNGIITHYFSPDEGISLFSHLAPLSARIHRWSMRVRGNDLMRSEIHGMFMKRL